MTTTLHRGTGVELCDLNTLLLVADQRAQYPSLVLHIGEKCIYTLPGYLTSFTAETNETIQCFIPVLLAS